MEPRAQRSTAAAGAAPTSAATAAGQAAAGHALNFQPLSSYVSARASPPAMMEASGSARGVGLAVSPAPSPSQQLQQLQPLVSFIRTISPGPRGGGGGGARTVSPVLPRAPAGTHPIAPIAHYPPSFPSAGVYAVALAMPQPPPRASAFAATAATAAAAPLSGTAVPAAAAGGGGASTERKKLRIAGPLPAGHTSPLPPQSPRPGDTSSGGSGGGGGSPSKEPFVFRSVGRAGKVDAWLSEEQKQNLAAELAAREAQSALQREREAAAAAFAAQRQRAMLAQSSLYASPPPSFSYAALGSNPLARTAPLPSSVSVAALHGVPGGPGVGAGMGGGGLSFQPARLLNTVTSGATGAAASSIDPHPPAHTRQLSYSFNPASAAAQGPGHEGMFVIRPGSRGANSPQQLHSHNAALSASYAHASLPPIPSAAQACPPSPLQMQAHSAHQSYSLLPYTIAPGSAALLHQQQVEQMRQGHVRQHSLRSGHSQINMANIFPATAPLPLPLPLPMPSPRSGAVGPATTTATSTSGFSPSPPPAPSASSASAPFSGARNGRPTNHFIIAPDRASPSHSDHGGRGGGGGGEEEEYQLGPSERAPSAEEIAAAQAAADDAAAAQEAADSATSARELEVEEQARNEASAHAEHVADQSAIAASAAADAAEAEAAAAAAAATAAAATSAALESASLASDESFESRWSEREHAALPLLLQYLASPAGRSLLVSKPAHGFLAEDPPALVAEVRAHPAAAPGGAVVAAVGPGGAGAGVGGAGAGAAAAGSARSSLPSSPVPSTRSGLSGGGGSGSGGTTSAHQVRTDLLHILSATGGSALIALWLLEKSRLCNGTSAGTVPGGSGGGGTGGGGGAAVPGARLHFAAPRSVPTRYAHLGEMVASLAQARERMQRQQRSWLAFLTDAGAPSSPNTNATDVRAPSSAPSPSPPPASSSWSDTTLPAPPSHPLFAHLCTRMLVRLHPHMDALWVLGGGGDAAFELVKSVVPHTHARDSAAHEGGDATTAAATTAAATAPVQFESFAAFMDAIGSRLEESKAALRSSLRSIHSGPAAPATAAAVGAAPEQPAGASADADPNAPHPQQQQQQQHAEPPSHYPLLDPSLQSFLSDPASCDAYLLPEGEYLYTEGSERVVGLLSTPRIVPSKPPLSHPASVSIGATHVSASASASPSPGHSPVRTSATAVAPSGAGSAAPDIPLLPQAVWLGPGVASTDAEAEAGSVAHGVEAQTKGTDFVTVEMHHQSDGSVRIEIVPTIDAAPAAESTPSTSAAAAATALAADPPVSRQASSSSVGRSSGGPLAPWAPSARASLSTPMASLLPPSLSLPPVPVPDDARRLCNWDVLTLTLHCAGGLEPARSILTSLVRAHQQYNLPPVTRLPAFLSAVRNRAREARTHLRDLAHWFDAHGHELLRSVGGNREAERTRSSGGSGSVKLDQLDVTAAPSASPSAHPGPSSSLLPPGALRSLYWSGQAGQRTQRIVASFHAGKKKFASIDALAARIARTNQEIHADYATQRRLVARFLETDPDAALFRDPSCSDSPLTFALEPGEHVDLLLARCTMPDSDASSSSSSYSSAAMAAAAALAAGFSSRNGSASMTDDVATGGGGDGHGGLGGGGGGGSEGGESEVRDGPPIPAHWTRTATDHASGASIVAHLSWILRERRKQTIQEHRVKLERAGTKAALAAAAAAASHRGSMVVSEGGNAAAAATTGSSPPLDRDHLSLPLGTGTGPGAHAGTGAGTPVASKVVQPLLFHSIDSLSSYMGHTLAPRMKSAVERTYAFVGSASSALLLRDNDPALGGIHFANPDRLHDFVPRGPAAWTVRDALLLFETCRAGHALPEYAARISDAKMAHVHRVVDQAAAAAATASASEGTASEVALPLHPLAVPCNGEPLSGLRGHSFHFPTASTLGACIDALYLADEAAQIDKLRTLAELVDAHAAHTHAHGHAASQSPRDVLLAWLQREENTVLDRALAVSLDAAAVDDLMHASGAGEHTLSLLQSLQQAGRSYTSMDDVRDAVAYEMAPEPQPKQGVLVVDTEVRSLLRWISRVHPSKGPVVFNMRMAVAQNAEPLSPALAPSTADSSVHGGGGGSGGSSGGGGGHADPAPDLNPLGLDAAALVASGDPIVPHLYGISLAEVAGMVGAAFGVANLRGLVGELVEKEDLRFDSFAHLKTAVMRRIRSLNPHRSWTAPPATILYDNPTTATSGAGAAPATTGAGAEAGGASVDASAETTVPTALVESVGSSYSYEYRPALDVYNYLFNKKSRSSVPNAGTGQAQPQAQPQSSGGGGSGGGGAAAVCRLLESRQAKIPVSVSDVAWMMRMEYCEAMCRIGDGAETEQAGGVEMEDELMEQIAPGETAVTDGEGGDPAPHPTRTSVVVPSLPSTSTHTLFLLQCLNDPPSSFRPPFPHLRALLPALRRARQSTHPSIAQAVANMGRGAREVFSFLSGPGGAAGAVGAQADLPGPGKDNKEKEKASQLAITPDLLASLMEAGGGLARSPGDDPSFSSSASSPSSAPPALTILSHLALLGTTFGAGQGAQMVGAVREQKERADLLRQALEDSVRAGMLQDEADAAGKDAPTTSSSSKKKLALQRTVPARVEAARAALALALEDLLPRLGEVRPTLASEAPLALSLRGVSSLVDSIDADAVAQLELLYGAYDSAAPCTPESNQSARALYASLAPVLSQLQVLYTSLPALSKHSNALFSLLVPHLHASLRDSYSAAGALLFHVQRDVTPQTVQPYVHLLLPFLRDTVAALAAMRSDADAVLAVQRSLSFVLQRLSSALNRVDATLLRVSDKIQANKAAAAATSAAAAGSPAPPADPLLALHPNLSSSRSYLQSLLPFLSALLQTNEHHLLFLHQLAPFFDEQMRPLLPAVLPLLVPPAADQSNDVAHADADAAHDRVQDDHTATTPLEPAGGDAGVPADAPPQTLDQPATDQPTAGAAPDTAAAPQPVTP